MGTSNRTLLAVALPVFTKVMLNVTLFQINNLGLLAVMVTSRSGPPPCPGCVTAKDRVTFGAGLYWALPACEARTVTWPAVPLSMMVFPETVAGPDSMEKLTGNPLVAVAETVNGAAVVSLFAIAEKLIVWSVSPGTFT